MRCYLKDKCVCKLKPCCDKPGHHTYVIHTIHESTSITGILIFLFYFFYLFIDDRQNYAVIIWELWECCSCSCDCLVSGCTCISMCVCVYICPA